MLFYPKQCRVLQQALQLIANGASYSISDGISEATHRVEVDGGETVYVFQAEKMHYHDDDMEA